MGLGRRVEVWGHSGFRDSRKEVVDPLLKVVLWPQCGCLLHFLLGGSWVVISGL